MPVEVGPGAFVEPKVIAARFAERRGVLLQLFIERAIAAPELVHEDEIEHARGFHQLGEGLAVAGGQGGLIHLQGHRRESRGHSGELRQIGHNGGGGQEDCQRFH